MTHCERKNGAIYTQPSRNSRSEEVARIVKQNFPRVKEAEYRRARKEAIAAALRKVSPSNVRPLRDLGERPKARRNTGSRGHYFALSPTNLIRVR